MKRLHLLALLGLAMADTDPRDFDRLCTSGECPAGWREVDGDCVLFMSGWDEARAREECRENKAEYRDYVLLREDSDSATRHSLPVCLVRRETQCGCGRPNREVKIVNGVTAEKNEYPWQVRLSISDCQACCGGSVLSRDTILTAAHCTKGWEN